MHSWTGFIWNQGFFKEITLSDYWIRILSRYEMTGLLHFLQHPKKRHLPLFAGSWTTRTKTSRNEFCSTWKRAKILRPSWRTWGRSGLLLSWSFWKFFSMLGFRHYCEWFIILSTGGQDAPRHQHVHLAGPRSQELQSTEEHLLFWGGFHFGLRTCQGQVQPARLSKVSNLRRTSFILCNCCLLKAPGFCFTLIIGTQYSSPNVMSLY